MHDTIVDAVKWVMEERTGKTAIDVDVVWEPKWTPRMISEEAKDQLGYF